MDAYIFQADLYCGPCMIESLIAHDKASPAARDMAPGAALEQITESNGFMCESDYDSDDLPKGPYADGGGEADRPQHCGRCRVFLENPLTRDGEIYVVAAAKERLSSTCREWHDFYSYLFPIPDEA